MTKATVVQIANDLLQHKGNISSWMELVSDYCNEDLKKREKGMKLFPNIPQNLQVQIIQGLVTHYCKKFNINCVMTQSNNQTFIINGVQQSNLQPIYYYI